jgi:hypothetical protein
MGQKTGLKPAHTTFTLSHLGQKWDKNGTRYQYVSRSTCRKNGTASEIVFWLKPLTAMVTEIGCVLEYSNAAMISTSEERRSY